MTAAGSPRDDAPLRPVRRPPPLAQRAYDEIRAALLGGAGSSQRERLLEDELARELSMSRTPVREALHRLVLAGLVEPSPGGGYRRRQATPRDVREQCELRLVLEPQAAALAAQRCAAAGVAGDDGDGAGARGAGARGASGTSASADGRDAVLAHPALARTPRTALEELELHVAIADASGNATLAALIRAVNERFAVHRAALVGDLDGDPVRRERDALLDALRAADPTAAATAMCALLGATQAPVLDALRDRSGAGR